MTDLSCYTFFVNPTKYKRMWECEAGSSGYGPTYGGVCGGEGRDHGSGNIDGESRSRWCDFSRRYSVSVLNSEREWCLVLLMVGGDCQRIYMLLVLMVYTVANLTIIGFVRRFSYIETKSIPN